MHIEYDGFAVRILPLTAHRAPGAKIVSRLRGGGDVPMTTDEIMALTGSE